MPSELVLNGHPTGVEPLRIMLIGPSIRSDWQNPAAHTHRAVMTVLTERGHQTIFLEARRNTAVEGLLADVGAAALLVFDRDFPDINYRSYDPPPRRELSVWLGRECAIADVVLLLDGLGEDIVNAYERTSVLDLVRLAERPESDGSVLINLETGDVIGNYSGAGIHDLLHQADEIAAAIESARTDTLPRR